VCVCVCVCEQTASLVTSQKFYSYLLQVWWRMSFIIAF